MHEIAIQSRFIIPSPKTSIKPLASTITSIFLFFRQEKADNDKCRFFKVAKTFWVLQNSKEVTDTMNKLNKRRKINYISTFHFPNLYTKFLHNKLPMVKNSFIDLSVVTALFV